MYATLLADARFHELLLTIDRDLADTCRADGCLACGGRLHSARYPRKPRGRPKTLRLGPEHDRRFSFCCAVDGCRGRETPASLRFLGRRFHIAAFVVLIAILRNGATDARMERLSQIVRVDRRTVGRWRRWWREGFTALPFWQSARARLMPPVDQARLPASLLGRFTGVMPEACFQLDGAEPLIALLRFLGPITGGAKGQAR